MDEFLELVALEPALDETIVTTTHRVGRKVPNLTVRGMDEHDIFAMAPLIDCDRVH
jgi:hypothetical protein